MTDEHLDPTNTPEANQQNDQPVEPVQNVPIDEEILDYIVSNFGEKTKITKQQIRR